MLYKKISSLDSYFLEIQEPRLRSDKWFPNFTPNSYLGFYTPKRGIPKLGVNFFIASATVCIKNKVCLHSLGRQNFLKLHLDGNTYLTMCITTVILVEHTFFDRQIWSPTFVLARFPILDVKLESLIHVNNTLTIYLIAKLNCDNG